MTRCSIFLKAYAKVSVCTVIWGYWYIFYVSHFSLLILSQSVLHLVACCYDEICLFLVFIIFSLSYYHRKERQLQEMMLKMKRHSVTGQLPVHLEQTLVESPFTDTTTEDEVDSHPDHIRQHSSPSRYIPSSGPKMERATSFDISRGRKRPFRRKRRISGTKEEAAGPTTLDPDMMDSKQTLLPAASHSPSHSPPLLPQQQTTPTREPSRGELLIGHCTSGESTPRVPQTHELPITAEGDLSPAVAQFLDSVKKHPAHIHHNVRRSNSNSSLRTHRRQGSNGSTHSFRNPSSPLSGSPIKGPSQCNSTSSLSKSRRAPREHTPSRRGSGSSIQYTKLDSSSSEEDDKEHETGTQSSDHNTATTSEGQSFISRLKSQANETQSSSTGQQRGHFSSSHRDLYSNESSCDAQCSDGGHDADGESDGNSLDLLSEHEPNESNLESLHNVESSDVTSTTPDILDSDSTLSLIPNSKSKAPIPHSPGRNVATLITQFETTSSDSSLTNSQNSQHQNEQPKLPLHIRRDDTVPLAESYSPKAVEDLLEGGW